MRAIILAAGAGRRLAPMNWDLPKCLLPCPQGTLLDNTIQSVIVRGVSEVAVVVGYQKEQVAPVLDRYAVAARLVVNEAYTTTNTIHSMWLARDYLDGDCLLFNGDVWFEHAILDQLLPMACSALAVDVKACGEEEVKVVVDAGARIVRIGKDVPRTEALGESIGIAKFNEATARELAASLDHFNTVLGQTNLFFESALDPILPRCVVAAVPLGGYRAVEIDTPDDYHRAKQIWSRVPLSPRERGQG